MAEPRYCRTLIVSARARSEAHLESYKPFNGALLVDLFAKAARKVAPAQREPSFELHAPYPYFFFGHSTLTDQQKRDLRLLPSSIVDCDIYRSGETDALKIATSAIAEFDYHHQGKTLLFVCDDACTEMMISDHFPATNDAELYAFLFSDLSNNAFTEIGKALLDGS